MTKVRKELAELAKVLEFVLDEVDLDKIELEYTAINEKFDLIKKIDTDGVEPTNFVHPIVVDPQMREDIGFNCNSNDTFSNCQTYKDNFVVIKNEK